MNTYDMAEMRKVLITLLSRSLKKDSKWYADDYEVIVKAVNKKTRKALIESLDRQTAIANVTKSEIKRNCQF